MSNQILLDMDGVIVDLRCPLPHVSSDQLIAFYRGELDVSREELWSSTNADWWANLHWRHDGREIVSICEKWVGRENVIICTKPADWPGSAEGKLRWLDREMPDYRQRFILTPQKQWVASPRSVLLDDTDHNVAEFRKAGGAAILCPRPWNANSKMSDMAPAFINMMLEEMTS